MVFDKRLFDKPPVVMPRGRPHRAEREVLNDILVKSKILIELKVASGLTKENYAQTINYLKATGIKVGLLVNFSNPKIEYLRFQNKFIETDRIDIKNLLIN